VKKKKICVDSVGGERIQLNVTRNYTKLFLPL